MSKRNKRHNAKNKYQAPVKSTAAVQELIPYPEAPRREGFDINKWRLAIRSAEDAMYPDRTLLLDIYNDILLDMHLTPSSTNALRQSKEPNSFSPTEPNPTMS